MPESLPSLPPDGSWRVTRRRLAPLLVVLIASLLVLFEREWRHGEIFSPADLLFEFHPWAHDAPLSRGTNRTRSDEAFYHQPLMATHFARLRAGDLPDYDDTRLSGVPSFFQGIDLGRAFSPFSLPFYALAPEDAVTWYAPLRLFVAALAMWLFLRDLGAGPLAAAAGGLAFGLNGHFLTWLSAPMPTVAAWLPLVLRQVRRSIRQSRLTDVAGLALAVGALCLGSYLATVLVCLFGAGVYGLVELWLVRARGEEDTLPTPSPAFGRRLGAVLLGGVLGLAVAAVSLVPMLAALSDSPARSRVMSVDGAAWPNLATLVMPDFWGSPVTGSWWHPDPTANYPEHVAYFGVAVMLLAGLGIPLLGWRGDGRSGGPRLATLSTHDVAIRWTFVGLTVLSLTRAYGVPPGRWLVWLPGQAQSNPFRWYALTACALAVLVGLGVQAWLDGDSRRARLRQLAGPLLVALLLGAATAAALATFLPEIRARNLQPLERAQVVRFALLGGGTTLVLLIGSWLESSRVRAAAGGLLLVLIAGDLVQAMRPFNPSVPRDRYYPPTAGLEWLREHASDARIAPVDTAVDLVEGHVWGMYGLSSVSGYDFHGDADYQRYLRLAQQPVGTDAPDAPTVWDFVGLRRETLDLRMLGVLGARYIVSAPLDVVPRGGGYVPLGPIGDGREVALTIPVRHDGLRRIDLLTATYARENAGQWQWTLRHEDGRVLASGAVAQRDLRDNDWWRLEWPPVAGTAGRRVTLTLRADGAAPGTGATVLATATPSTVGTTLRVDGRDDARTLWFRAYSTAPERFGDARLAYWGDLNVYRNPYARPRAWFVERVNLAEASAHASAMHTRPFDPAREAWLADAPAAAPTTTARVTSVELDDDRRTIGVDAPQGGVLIVADRAHRGWGVTIDGRAVPWTVANAVLIGIPVPPGSRTVNLAFHQPFVRPALGLSLVSVAGIAFAFLVGVRRPRS